MIVSRNEWTATLPAEAGSTPAARRFLRGALPEACPDPARDTAELCLSELVTNAVLHAGTAVDVTVRLDAEALYLAVRDASAAVPQRVPHSRSAGTGRGLGIVAALSRDWGIERGAHGKTVWCLLPVTAGELGAGAVSEAWTVDLEELLAEDGEVPRHFDDRIQLTVVHLTRYPVRRGVRAREHFEALRRECQLLAVRGRTGGQRAPERLLELAGTLATRYRVNLAEAERRKLEAFRSGTPCVDLTYHVPPETGVFVAAWQEMLAEIDRYCRDERLLSLAAPRDVLELQGWTLREFQRQIAGGAPRPWPGTLD